MLKKMDYIHNVTSLVHVSKKLSYEFLTVVNVFNIVDESLLQNTISDGGLSKNTVRRLVSYMESAELAGADAIMVTCSSVGPSVAVGKQLFDTPILRVDQPMVEIALEMGEKIGVLATLQTTMEPTCALINELSLEKKKKTGLISKVCRGAFEALFSGDLETHDRIVKSELERMFPLVDVIILAQASMARVIGQADSKKPVLSSPGLAVEYIAKNIL